jgi:hypothetical protein
MLPEGQTWDDIAAKAAWASLLLPPNQQASGKR